MTPVDLLAGSALGSLLGMRHALEPDHLAAVSTLITAERDGRARRAAWLGACWGVGHSLTLVAAGAVLIGLRRAMPPSVADAFEGCVAVMLIGLGLRAIYQAVVQGPVGPPHVHRHGRLAHIHAGAAPHVHVGRWTLARRPLLVGAVHGLAGSGALTAAVLAELPSNTARLAYMALFGLGSTVGMAALSGLLGWPVGRLARRRGVARATALAVGCLSLLLGVWWGYPLVGRLLG